MLSCNEKQPANAIVDTDPILCITTGDTLKIFERAAIFYSPDSLRLEQIKKMLGRDTFRIALDDYAGAANEAEKYLRVQSISIVQTHNQKYIQFGETMENTLVKLDTLREYWGLYFFAPGKKPKFIDEFKIEKEYQEYFK